MGAAGAAHSAAAQDGEHQCEGKEAASPALQDLSEGEDAVQWQPEASSTEVGGVEEDGGGGQGGVRRRKREADEAPDNAATGAGCAGGGGGRGGKRKRGATHIREGGAGEAAGNEGVVAQEPSAKGNNTGEGDAGAVGGTGVPDTTKSAEKQHDDTKQGDETAIYYQGAGWLYGTVLDLCSSGTQGGVWVIVLHDCTLALKSVHQGFVDGKW